MSKVRVWLRKPVPFTLEDGTTIKIQGFTAERNSYAFSVGSVIDKKGQERHLDNGIKVECPQHNILFSQEIVR
jgi:hypothetical protein